MKLKRMRRMKGGVIDRRAEGPTAGGSFPGLGGGTGGGGFPIPTGKGGIGIALVIVVVLMFLGGSQIFGGGGSDVPGLDQFGGAGTATTQGDTIDPTDPTGRFVAAVTDDVQFTWKDIFERSGKTYEPTEVVLFTGSTNTGCGQASSATGPFYCPADRLVYLDTSFFKELERRFGAPGDFAQAYVIAHEIGHHVQTLLGIEREVRRMQQEDPSRANELSVRMELQADCFAGVWGRAAQAAGILQPGDVEEGLNAASQIGDDRIQESVQGRSDPETFTHGTAEQRSTWLSTGIQVGNPDACDTFANDIYDRFAGYARGVTRSPGRTATVYDLSLEELTERLSAWGEPAFRAKQVHAQLWRRSATYEEMSDVSPALRERLAAELPIGIELLDERTADRGATRKALLQLGGRHVIETVLMGYKDRVTVCVSSQVGCAMDCGFCATGQMGLLSNLTSGEIAAQVVWARREAAKLPVSTPQRLTNVVFMGMGEPLANYRPVHEAVTRIVDPGFIGLGARHVTVSTVGLVPGIRRLTQDLPQVGLAVSLHAADDELRDELVPVNRRYPLAALETAIDEWRRRTHRRVSIEWAMIDGTNDDDRQAGLLAEIAYRLGAHVNLIPLNPTPGWPTQPSPPERIKQFARILKAGGVNVTIRDTRGSEIDAACGQLRLEHEGRAPSPA